MTTPYYIFPSFKETDKKYPIYVVTVGRETNPLRTNRPNGIPNYQLLFTTKGSAEIILGGETITVKKNSLMYLKPNTPQYYYGTGDWDTIWVTYNHNGSFEMLPIDNGVYNLPTIEPFVNLLSLMLKGRGTLNFGKNSSMLLYNLLLELSEHLECTNSYGSRSIIKPAIEYIEQNYKNAIEASYLAKLCNISYEHFCRNFKKNYNIRPLEYIQRLRIQESKRLMICQQDYTLKAGTFVFAKMP